MLAAKGSAGPGVAQRAWDSYILSDSSDDGSDSEHDAVAHTAWRSKRAIPTDHAVYQVGGQDRACC